jgi:hypothetical protein
LWLLPGYATEVELTKRHRAEDPVSGVGAAMSPSADAQWYGSLDWPALITSLRDKIGEDPLRRFKFYVFEDIEVVFAVSQFASTDHYAWTSTRGWRTHDGRVKPDCSTCHSVPHLASCPEYPAYLKDA